MWAWRTSSGWQHELCSQHLNHALNRDVKVPDVVKALREEARVQAAAPENRLESVALEEMRTAAARALIRQDECAAKQLILNLVGAGADLDVLTGDGRTLLMIAVLYDFRGITQLLLERGAYVNGQCDNGRAALHGAARRANIEIMGDLLAKCADPHLGSIDGRTASSDARLYAPPAMHDAIRKVLRDYGFEEYACEKRLWAKRRLCDSNEKLWRLDQDEEYMPME